MFANLKTFINFNIFCETFSLLFSENSCEAQEYLFK